MKKQPSRRKAAVSPKSHILWPALTRVAPLLLAFLALSGVARAAVNTAPLPPVKSQFFSSVGLPLAFGCVFTYQAGTTNALASYTDGTGSTPNANPTILDAGGFASIWLGPQKYKVSVYSFGGVACASGSLQYTIDNVYGPNLALSGAVTFTAQAAPTCNAANYSLWADSGATFLKACNNGTISTLVTDTATQILTNKTLTSPVLNTPTINSASFSGTQGAAAFGAIQATSLGATTPGTVSATSYNKVIQADVQAGVDACAKVAAAIALLPATGGTVDARGLQGTQACASDPFASVGTKPVQLLLGAGKITTSVPWTLHSYLEIIGSGASVGASAAGSTALATTGAIWALKSADTTASVQSVVLRDFSIDLSGNTSAVGAIDWTGVAYSRVYGVSAILPTGGSGIVGMNFACGASCVSSYYNDFFGLNIYAVNPANTHIAVQFGEGGNEEHFYGGSIANVAQPIVCVATGVSGGSTNDYFSGMSVQSFQLTAINLGASCSFFGFTHLRFENAMGGAGSLTLQRTSNVVTATFSQPHNFSSGAVGAWIFVSGAAPGDLGGAFQISTVPDSTHLTWAQTAANEAGTATSLSGAGIIWTTAASATNNSLEGVTTGGTVQVQKSSDSSPSSFLRYNSAAADSGGVISLPGTGGSTASICVGAACISPTVGSKIVAPSTLVDGLIVSSGAGKGISIVTTGVSSIGRLSSPASTNDLQLAATVSGNNLRLATVGTGAVQFYAGGANVGSVDSSGNVNFTGGLVPNSGHVLFSSTAPTISSGFGTSASVTGNNGTAAFEINVGTGGTASSGVIGLPNPGGLTGWNCYCTDITTNSTGVFACKQTASSASSATIGNFSDVAVATAWTASDKVRVSCFAY